MIEIRETTPSEKLGKPKHILGITLRGIIYHFVNRKTPSHMMSKIASTQSDLLPLVFGKWQTFIEAGVEEQAISRWYDTIKEIITFAHFGMSQSLPTRTFFESFIRERLRQDNIERYITTAFYIVIIVHTLEGLRII